LRRVSACPRPSITFPTIIYDLFPSCRHEGAARQRGRSAGRQTANSCAIAARYHRPQPPRSCLLTEPTEASSPILESADSRCPSLALLRTQGGLWRIGCLNRTPISRLMRWAIVFYRVEGGATDRATKGGLHPRAFGLPIWTLSPPLGNKRDVGSSSVEGQEPKHGFLARGTLSYPDPRRH